MSSTKIKPFKRKESRSPWRYAGWAMYAAVAAAVLGLAIVKVFLAAWTISDSFTRNESAGWGIAAGNHPYSIAGSRESFAVRDSAGTIAIPAPDTTYGAYLSTASARDVDVTFRVKTDKVAEGGSEIAYFVARRQTFGTQYLGRVRLAPDGQVWLQAVRERDGVATLLGSERLVRDLRHQANAFIWLRGQIVGTAPTTIRLKAWADGTPEPPTWRYTVEDLREELALSGQVGLRAYLSGQATNAPVVFTFDDLSVTSLDFIVGAEPPGDERDGKQTSDLGRLFARVP